VLFSHNKTTSTDLSTVEIISGTDFKQVSGENGTMFLARTYQPDLSAVIQYFSLITK
jgi:hypothetical protein